MAGVGDVDIYDFIADLPKAELHLHIEGTLSPETVLRLARRNGVDLPFSSTAEIEQALEDRPIDLEGFLGHHYLVVQVFRTEEDFFDVTYELLRECRENNIVYTELFFDPQAHTSRGVLFDSIVEGIGEGLRRGSGDFGVEAGLIMCLNRERSVASAREMLSLAERYRDQILGLGLDSYEEGNPPRKFVEIYANARDRGYHLTAHCDVDQTDSVDHIWECLDLLGVERIDHGVNAIEDPRLIQELISRGVGLAVSPVRLNADRGPEDVDRIKQLYEAGVLVSLNTDDPAEFLSGYLTNMLLEVQAASGYEKRDLVRFIANAFESSWLPPARKASYLTSLHEFARSRGVTV